MADGGNDRLPFGMRPGVNDNWMQPSFRDGPRQSPRPLWPILVSIVVALVVIAALIASSVLR
jgi:hypothetical protein